jgi:hypothetical protein
MPCPNLKELGSVIQVAKTFDIAKLGFCDQAHLTNFG